MTANFPLLLEYGGERPTEVEAGSQDLISRNPQRDDPPRSKNRAQPRTVTRCFDGCGSPDISEANNYFSCRSCGMIYNKNSGNRLIVRRVGGLFELRAFKNGHDTGDIVKAVDAQMIIDYVRATWPVGTIVQWIIIPRERTMEPVLPRAALIRIPIGSRL